MKLKTLKRTDHLAGEYKILLRRKPSFKDWDLSSDYLPVALDRWLRAELEAVTLRAFFPAESEETLTPTIDISLPFVYSSTSDDDVGGDGHFGPPVDYPLTIQASICLEENAFVSYQFRLDNILKIQAESFPEGAETVRKIQAELRNLADSLEPLLSAAEAQQ